MTVVSVIELVATSEQSFDDALRHGLEETARTIRGITGIEIKNWTVDVKNNAIVQYKVTLHIAFVVESDGDIQE